jgi:hypothetical protein
MDVLDLENRKRKDPDRYPMRGYKTLEAYWAWWTPERLERWRAGRES